jgi:hypothetical protein
VTLRRFLAIQVALWTTYAVVHYLAALPAVTPDERPAMALAKGIRALTGLGITSLLWPLARRRDPRRAWTWAGLAALAIAAGFAWSIVDRVLLVTVAAGLGIAIPWDRFPRGVELEYFFLVLAWTAGALVFLLWERERATRESLLEHQIAAREAQVRELAGRLHPHFLFNSLNTIRSFAGEDPERAREMLTRLAAFLRHALSIDPARPVPLAAEIESARAYLWIEEARFEPELEVAIEVGSETGSVLVPPLILQPLIENALLHGDPAADGVRRVRLSAARWDGRLRLEVASTGALARGVPEGQGLGLTRSRLRQAYGAGARLDLAEREGWVVARLEIDAPAEIAPEGRPG